MVRLIQYSVLYFSQMKIIDLIVALRPHHRCVDAAQSPPDPPPLAI